MMDKIKQKLVKGVEMLQIEKDDLYLQMKRDKTRFDRISKELMQLKQILGISIKGKKKPNSEEPKQEEQQEPEQNQEESQEQEGQQQEEQQETHQM